MENDSGACMVLRSLKRHHDKMQLGSICMDSRDWTSPVRV